MFHLSLLCISLSVHLLLFLMKKAIIYNSSIFVFMFQANKNGATAVEFDVDLTVDDQVVVIHDDTVDRTTDGTGFVNEMTLELIRKLDASANHPKRYLWTRDRINSIWSIPVPHQIFQFQIYQFHVCYRLKNSLPSNILDSFFVTKF